MGRTLEGPPGWPAERYLDRLRHSAMRLDSPEAAAWRRQACKYSPLLFMLHYLAAHSELPDGNGGIVHALSEFHIEIAMSAKRWARQDIGPKEVRDAWIAPRHSGKALALGTPVLTANRGWTTHGDLQPGDRVFDERGKQCNVVAVSPRWLDRPCHRITFSDGEQIVADADHEWFAFDRSRNRSLIRTTSDMAGDWLLQRSRGTESRYAIANCAPLRYPEADLPIAPYVLGVWLGDGSSAGGRITVGHDDADCMVAELARDGEHPNLTRPPSSPALAIQLGKPRPERCPREHLLHPARPGALGRYAPCKQCVADHQRRTHGGPELAAPTNEPLLVRLRTGGLLHNKHIPEQYFSASYDQRLALLQGLMDTDGSISRDYSSCEFTSMNERLARDVLRLVLTMGIRAKVKESRAKLNGVDKGPLWRMHFTTGLPVFRLPRKLSLIRPAPRAGRRHIVNVERVENQTTSCISVDSPSHLYLAGRSLIPTHNSTMIFLVLALWALAFEHRKYVVVYADTADQARLHLATLKLELARNERLRRDFPALCEPMREAGATVMNTKDGYVAASGVAIMVKGMDSATLGVKLGARRPDALIFDDLEPKESRYNAELKARRLKDLIEAILPCNHSAVVQVAGTTVMAGSIVADMIENADWVAAENISVHHFPAILIDPETGEERSLWPRKWSLEFLREERRIAPAAYAKNFDNRPVNADGTHWAAEDFVYRDLSQWVDERILVVDPAAKAKKSNDESGLALLSYAGNVRMVMVEQVRGVRMRTDELRALVSRIVTKHGVRLVLVDTTNGGDHVLNTLSPLPPGVKLKELSIRRGKADRFTELHDLYRRGRVVHKHELNTLETQMKAWPRTMTDDRIDAVALGTEYLMRSR